MTNQMIRRLVYAFKRQWSAELTYVQIRSAVVDDSTGKRVIIRDVFQIPVVILPIKEARKFIQDIGYLAANKNFTYGALNDFNNMTIIISADDMPAAFENDLNGYVVYKGKRYERVTIEDLFDSCYIMVVQGVEGANPYAFVDVTAESRLQIAGRVAHELV